MSDRQSEIRYTSTGHSRRRRRRRNTFNPIPVILLLLLLGLVIFGTVKLFGAVRNRLTGAPASAAETTAAVESETTPEETPEETTAPAPAQASVMEQAELLAAQYDYDAAIRLLQENGAADNSEMQAAVEKFTAAKNACVRTEINTIPHVFFHTLVYDTDLAFDGDTKQNGYNQVMTTVTEFNRILQQMYDRGYVLVRLHDMAYEVPDTANGGMKMVEGDIMLPEGKKAFIMSQDDVCYYEYMKGDGMATKMIIGDDGRPVNEYTEKDGSISVGSYDLVPLLDDFIDTHPDFSYRGAKAVIAFTGYNGVLGYRTDESYDQNSSSYDPKLEDSPNPNIEADRQECIRVLKALVDDGYELSSHSWGHRDMNTISLSHLKTDSDKWDRNVNSLIREATGADCDILIYPKGADIGSWHGYGKDVINKDNNHTDGYEKYLYLHQLGFRYYCNVDSNQPWVQKGNDYLRSGRLNMDGDRMWRDMQNPSKAKLSSFIDVPSVFDSARPTPVPGY